MTNKELQEILKTLPPDAKVFECEWNKPFTKKCISVSWQRRHWKEEPLTKVKLKEVPKIIKIYL